MPGQQLSGRPDNNNCVSSNSRLLIRECALHALSMHDRCGEESHEPANCKRMLEWKEKNANESETANWILANTKRCPKCNTRIEKNQGCNHMTCRECKVRELLNG